jgi:hypothetical protein
VYPFKLNPAPLCKSTSIYFQKKEKEEKKRKKKKEKEKEKRKRKRKRKRNIHWRTGEQEVKLKILPEAAVPVNLQTIIKIEFKINI